MSKIRTNIRVVLNDIRSVHNVGAIWRTAEGVGATEMILVGYTPEPVDRFGRLREDINKAALGAEHMVPWRHFGSLAACMEALKKEGVTVALVEQMHGAISYQNYRPPPDVAFVFGNEREGIPEEARSLADACLYIPMSGQKESLNVSTSAGIILFAARGQ